MLLEALRTGRRYPSWEDFSIRHPKTYTWLAQGYRLYRRRRQFTYRRLYTKFRAYTMLSRAGYCENLALCDWVRDVPGAVVECGTWKGGMIAGIASLLGNSRNYFVYDSFEGLPPAGPQDRDRWGQTGTAWQAQTTHNDRAPEACVREVLTGVGVQAQIVKGWFADTLSSYPGDPIAILRADGDWYSSTMDILKHLYQYVVPGGIIILDDYYYWDGCAKAVHDFLSQEQISATIRTWPGSGGYAYIVKR